MSKNENIYTYHNARVCTVDDSNCWIGCVRDDLGKLHVSDEFDTEREAISWLQGQAKLRGEHCKPTNTTFGGAS
jgi:hypothetical protein